MIERSKTQLLISVPPDVSIHTTNVTIADPSVSLFCQAKSYTEAEYRYGNWSQFWHDDQPVRSWTINGNGPWLNITDLSYENSGFYTCSASNGVHRLDRDEEVISSTVYLVVKCKKSSFYVSSSFFLSVCQIACSYICVLL